MFIEKFLHRHSGRVNQDETFAIGASVLSDFYANEGGIEIMKSYSRSLLFFCVSFLSLLPSFSEKTPLKIAQMKNQIIYELGPLLSLSYRHDISRVEYAILGV